jgi:hypothetical protein
LTRIKTFKINLSIKGDLPYRKSKLSLMAVYVTLLLFGALSLPIFNAYAQQGGVAIGGSATGSGSTGGAATGGNAIGQKAIGGQAIGGNATSGNATTLEGVNSTLNKISPSITSPMG